MFLLPLYNIVNVLLHAFNWLLDKIHRGLTEINWQVTCMLDSILEGITILIVRLFDSSTEKKGVERYSKVNKSTWLSIRSSSESRSQDSFQESLLDDYLQIVYRCSRLLDLNKPSRPENLLQHVLKILSYFVYERLTVSNAT